MKRFTWTALGLLTTALARARAQVADFDPNDVEPLTRMSWCDDQEQTCTTLCGKEPEVENSCDHNTLTYACRCHNGTEPGLQYYTQTILTYECQEQNQNCIEESDGSDGQLQSCQSQYGSRCGTLDPSTAWAPDTSSTNPDSTSETEPSATKTTTSSGTASDTAENTSTASPSEKPWQESGGSDGQRELSMGAIVGIGVAALVIIIALVALLFFRLGKRKHGQRNSSSNHREHDGGISGPFEKLQDDASSSQVFEMSTARDPIELDSTPRHSPMQSPKAMMAPSNFSTPPPPRYPSSAGSPSSHAVELDSRMVPIDIKVETSSRSPNPDNTKYRF